VRWGRATSSRQGSGPCQPLRAAHAFGELGRTEQRLQPEVAGEPDRSTGEHGRNRAEVAAEHLTDETSEQRRRRDRNDGNECVAAERPPRPHRMARRSAPRRAVDNERARGLADHDDGAERGKRGSNRRRVSPRSARRSG